MSLSNAKTDTAVYPNASLIMTFMWGRVPAEGGGNRRDSSR